MTVQLGVVLMCHAQLDIAAGMARVWHEGGARVAIHIDSKADPDEVEQMESALAGLENISYSPRHDCAWGMFSLVQATQDASAQLLATYPDLTHVYLASGTCLPLRPIADLIAYFERHQGRDFIQSVTSFEVQWVVDGLSKERFTRYFPASYREKRRLFDFLIDAQRRLRIKRKLPEGLNPHIGSQWWCLRAETLRAILNDPRRAEFDQFFKYTWIPDESYFQTLARMHSSGIESRSLTVAKFDVQGKPYVFYDDHKEMLEDSGCFVARKIWPQAEELYRYFPRPVNSASSPHEPDPLHIDRLVDRAVARRTLGRPGLYMQSRYPAKDRENGKTPGPYILMQGFTDLFVGFEEWLWDRVDVTVHGHLFSPEQVEFAGRATTGPGALTDSPSLRDLDPKSFLASLIRFSKDPFVFQFSPRDSQALQWFMTTDPNATICVITGAWLAPLMESDMPFDDIRRIALLLEEAEQKFLDALRSVWVKARVRIWDLGEFLIDPAGVVNEALDMIDPSTRLYVNDMPPMRDMENVARFVQSLRNAGLYPRTMGNLPLNIQPGREI